MHICKKIKKLHSELTGDQALKCIYFVIIAIVAI